MIMVLIVEDEHKNKHIIYGFDVLDTGELLMSDGSIVGHRKFRHIYKQNHNRKIKKVVLKIV